MFVRVQHDVSRKRPRWRVQLVEGHRIDGKVRQRLLREIGTAYDEDTMEQLRAEGELLKISFNEQLRDGVRPLFSSPTIAEIRRQAQRQAERAETRSPTPVHVEDLVHTGMQVSAAQLVWGELYSQIGWDQVLTARCWSANRILKDLVLARLIKPRSKRRTVAEQPALAGPKLSLGRVYQTMDHLDAFRIAKIQRGWQQRVRSLLPQEITAVFYDTTTLAFESAREDLGELRQKGYSKDGKPHDVQVLFALIVTAEGLPLGYRVYPGNRYEGHTLLEAVQSLKQEGFTDSITVVADAGLCNQENRQLLRDHGYSYVLGRGVRKLARRWQAQLFDLNQYQTITLPNQQQLQVLELLDGEQKIIVTYSARRARHDAEQRQRAIKKLRQLVGKKAPSKKLMPKHLTKFLKVETGGTVSLKEEVIVAEAQWDGLHAIVTHRSNPHAAADLVSQYRELWHIEDCFRTNKHDLKIRPIYHWKDRRIHAHLSICFMAFCCLQELRHRLRTRGIHHTLPELLAALENTRLVLVESSSRPDQRIVITQPLTKKVRDILRAVGVPWPSHSFVIPKTSSGPQTKSIENSLFVVPQKAVQSRTAPA